MYLAELRISNFRQFGAENRPFTLTFNPGVTALVGENDAGKTAIIDAIRYVLLTRDVEYLKVQEEDFHIPTGGGETREITLRCKFLDLDMADKGAFAEFLTYESDGICLYIHWQARRLPDTGGGRRRADVSIHAGPDGAGPTIDTMARDLLATAYLKPLRDAEREMSPGRGSRLSQILSAIESVKAGAPFDNKNPLGSLNDVDDLSLLGLTDFMRSKVEKQSGLTKAETSINSEYLDRLTLQGDGLKGRIRFTEDGSDETRLRRLLERLELGLNGKDDLTLGTYGLGSNNLLFMACELLLLGKEDGGLPSLLVEEPEAHLHPQRQLRLMRFLEEAAQLDPEGKRRAVQVILTTHSPNLASQIQVQNLVLLKSGRAYPLAEGKTALDTSDYRFLHRFLDVTKANLFFARGVIIVEGDAEAILLPSIARLLGKDLTAFGISIVNVGGTGLRRFARVFQRQAKGEEIGIPVACVTDLDIMPDCAPEILGLIEGPNQRWRTLSGLEPDPFDQVLALQDRRDKLSKGDGQGVRTFIADEWTLEYDLAFAGLDKEVFEAAWMAKNDDPLNSDQKTPQEVRLEAQRRWQVLLKEHPDNKSERCTHIYQLFHSKRASKAIAAQYLVQILEERFKGAPEDLAAKLPSYIKAAIEHLTKVVPTPAIPPVPIPGIPAHV